VFFVVTFLQGYSCDGLVQNTAQIVNRVLVGDNQIDVRHRTDGNTMTCAVVASNPLWGLPDIFRPG
jgi:hypothetical protein